MFVGFTIKVIHLLLLYGIRHANILSLKLNGVFYTFRMIIKDPILLRRRNQQDQISQRVTNYKMLNLLPVIVNSLQQIRMKISKSGTYRKLYISLLMLKSSVKVMVERHQYKSYSEYRIYSFNLNLIQYDLCRLKLFHGICFGRSFC